MKKCVLLFPLAICLLLSACHSISLYTVRTSEMHQTNPPKVQVFAPGEHPAIVIELPKHCGWGQRSGTVWVDEALTGSNAWKEARFLREGSTNYFLPPNLSADTYIATLMADGEAVASTNFDVH